MQARILRLQIENFRCFKKLDFLPEKTNVLVGANNVGKTAILDALYLVLGGASRYSSDLITENDFHRRDYLPHEPESAEIVTADGGEGATVADVEDDPQILIEVTVGPLVTPEEKLPFVSHLEAWSETEQRIISMEEDESALDHHPNCVRFTFLAWYDPEEDDFMWRTVFRYPEDGSDLRDRRPVKQESLRTLGFLMYRDYRASRHPITLSTRQLFHKLLTAYSSRPKTYERLLSSLSGSGDALHDDPDFAQIVEDFRSELERYLPFPGTGSEIRFDVTNLTRVGVREATQAFVNRHDLKLPVEAYGAGTRSVAALASLTLFARKREHALLAIEEPETFLYPASQRAVVREIRDLASQLFLTTHSPYVLDLFEPDEIGVLNISTDGAGEVRRPTVAGVKAHSRYYRVLRSGLSEAILSPRAILVEGESDAPIFRGFAEISRMVCPGDAVDLDRLGAAVVECQGVGEIAEVSSFLEQVGVGCFTVHDSLSDDAELEKLKTVSGPVFDTGYKGIEELLASELPDLVLRQLLAWAQAQTGLKKVPELDAAAADPNQIKEGTKRLLSGNKRVPALYTHLLATCEGEAVCPTTLCSMFRSIREWAAPSAEEEAAVPAETEPEAVP